MKEFSSIRLAVERGQCGGLRTAGSGALAAACYFAIAHLPLGLGGFPPVLSIVAAVAWPRLAAPLCIAASMVQDAVGLVPDAARLAVIGSGLVHVSVRGAQDLRASGRWLQLAIGASLIAITSAAIVSLFGWLGWGAEQSDSRPWILVAAADLLMLVIGASIGASVAKDKPTSNRVMGGLSVAIICMGVRIYLQWWFGPLTGFSSVSMPAIEAADQLMGRNPPGVFRYIGSMLTPNAMSMAVCFCLLLAWPVAERFRRCSGVAMASMMMVAATFGGSKSSLIVGIVAMLVLPGPLVGSVALCLLAGGLWLDQESRSWCAMRFRIGLGGSDVEAMRRTVRGGTLGLTPPIRDALWGLGLSHWPIFYSKSVGHPMSDPHSYPISHPWTFGVPGIGAFGVVIAGLARKIRTASECRGPAAVLLSVLLIRDLFAVPLIFGTTSLSLLLWSAIAKVLVDSRCAHSTEDGV